MPQCGRADNRAYCKSVLFGGEESETESKKKTSKKEKKEKKEKNKKNKKHKKHKKPTSGSSSSSASDTEGHRKKVVIESVPKEFEGKIFVSPSSSSISSTDNSSMSSSSGPSSSSSSSSSGPSFDTFLSEVQKALSPVGDRVKE
jgi:hypothetical protein